MSTLFCKNYRNGKFNPINPDHQGRRWKIPDGETGSVKIGGGRTCANHKGRSAWGKTQGRMPWWPCRFGGFCTNVDLFDAKFFRLSATEAAALDPQQRILMEETRQALASAHGSSSQILNSNSATGPCPVVLILANFKLLLQASACVPSPGVQLSLNKSTNQFAKSTRLHAPKLRHWQAPLCSGHKWPKDTSCFCFISPSDLW